MEKATDSGRRDGEQMTFVVRLAAAGVVLLAVVILACGRQAEVPTPGPSSISVAVAPTPSTSSAQAEHQAAARPVLHLDTKTVGSSETLVTRGVYPDGREFAVVVPALGAVWSPDGTQIAYVTADGGALKTVDLQGRERSLFHSGRDWEPIYVWPTWSPDGRKIAVVTVQWCLGGSRVSSLFIIDAADDGAAPRSHGPYDFWEAATTLEDGPTQFSLPKRLRWSPDGGRILISWDKAVVIDVETGKSETISTMPVVAEWAPGGDAVYYFEIADPGSRADDAPGGFYVRKLGEPEPSLLADSKRLADLGLSMVQGPVLGRLTLSPNGSRLAVATGPDAAGGGRLLIYALNGEEPLALDRPQASFRNDFRITALEWAPGGNSLAVVAANEEDVTIRLLDLATGVWETLRSVDVSPNDTGTLGFKILSWAL